jgi:RHS repeat-associated protein
MRNVVTYGPGEKPACAAGPSGTLTKVRDALGNETELRHDDNGNLTKVIDALDRETDYAYDEVNELTQVTSPSGSGNAMIYTYDLLDRLLTFMDFEAKQTSYAYDFRGGMTRVGATAEIRTCRLRDASTSSLGQYEYTPYGLVYGESGISQIPRKYTGHDPDVTSMLYYAPFRYYNPVVARWMTRDPVGMVDGVNVYGYANDNPACRIDVRGDSALTDCVHCLTHELDGVHGSYWFLIGVSSDNYSSRRRQGFVPFAKGVVWAADWG